MKSELRRDKLFRDGALAVTIRLRLMVSYSLRKHACYGGRTQGKRESSSATGLDAKVVVADSLGGARKRSSSRVNGAADWNIRQSYAMHP